MSHHPARRYRLALLASITLFSLSGCASTTHQPTSRPSLLTIDFELDMKNSASPREGVLTGGQPSLADLEALSERGYQTVINLRATDEAGQEGEVDKAVSLGLDYVALPIASADDLTPENARTLAALLADADRKPLLLHCGSSNRVGALLALAAFHAEGASAEEAMAIGKTGGLGSLEDAVRERLVAVDID